MLRIYFRVETCNTRVLDVLPYIKKDVGTFLTEVGLVDLRTLIIIVLVPLIIELIHDKRGVMAVAQSAVVVYDAVKVILGFYFLTV